MNRCTVGFEFRDEIRIHESIGLETVPTEQLVVSWRDSHHGEPAILIGDRYLIKDRFDFAAWGQEQPEHRKPADWRHRSHHH